MPGLNIVACRGINRARTMIEDGTAIMKHMRHSEDYRETVLIADAGLVVGAAAYETYPILSVSDSSADAILEGAIYDSKEGETGPLLTDFARSLCGASDAREVARRWVRSHDGDFVVVVHDKRARRLLVMNDALGRLPLYLYQDDEQVILSRETKFITAFLGRFAYDRHSIAETLIFGYTVGAGTLIEGVRRVDPGTLLCIDLRSARVEETRTYQLNLDELQQRGSRGIAKNAKEMSDRFKQACSHIASRFRGYEAVVSLSGGFDSRCVLAGMRETGIGLSSFTYKDSVTATRGRDSVYAEQVARSFAVPWTLVDYPGLASGEMDHLLWAKDGLNYAGMAFILPIHRDIGRRYGQRVLHMTGDNGDRTLDPQCPPVSFRSRDHLYKYIIDRNTRIEVGDAAEICGLKEQDVGEKIVGKLREYPEADYRNIYRHFIIAERLFNWNFQAEDRNRLYMWHATPFSSLPYFEYAMGVPDSEKQYWRITEEFLRQLDPKCLTVNYANWAAPITSYKRYWNPMKRIVYENLPARLRILVRDRTLYRSLEVEGGVRAYFDNCVARMGEGEPLFNLNTVRSYTKTCNVNSYMNILSSLAFVKVHDERVARIRREITSLGAG